jgi:hypothetical protein
LDPLKIFQIGSSCIIEDGIGILESRLHQYDCDSDANFGL